MASNQITEGMINIIASNFMEDAAENKWDSNTFMVKASQKGLSSHPGVQGYAQLLKQREGVGRTNTVEKLAQAETVSAPGGEMVGEVGAQKAPTVPGGPSLDLQSKITQQPRVGATDQRDLMSRMASSGEQVGGQGINPEEVKNTLTYQGLPEPMTDLQKTRETRLGEKDDLAGARLELQKARFEHQQAKDEVTLGQAEARIKTARDRLDIVVGGKKIQFEETLKNSKKALSELMTTGKKPTGNVDPITDEPEFIDVTEIDINRATQEIARIQQQLNKLDEEYPDNKGKKPKAVGGSVGAKPGPYDKAVAEQPKPAGPVTFRTPQEYYALPSGTVFIDPITGATRKKP